MKGTGLMSKKKHVELEKLRLGITKQGIIVAGEASPDGSIKDEKAHDVTEDFYNLVMIISQARLAAQKLGETAKIVKPSVKEIKKHGKG